MRMMKPGRCYERGDYETAVKHYTSCLNSAPPQWSLAAKALGNRGAARTMLGRHDDALNDCDAAVELEPGLAKVHNRSARLRLALGRSDEARRSFERVRTLRLCGGNGAVLDEASAERRARSSSDC